MRKIFILILATILMQLFPSSKRVANPLLVGERAGDSQASGQTQVRTQQSGSQRLSGAGVFAEGAGDRRSELLHEEREALRTCALFQSGSHRGADRKGFTRHVPAPVCGGAGHRDTRPPIMNTYSAAARGILADAYVQLRDYDNAVRVLDEMVRLKPNLSSYSRISYMRELKGDTDGAITAMEMAIQAGAPDGRTRRGASFSWATSISASRSWRRRRSHIAPPFAVFRTMFTQMPVLPKLLPPGRTTIRLQRTTRKRSTAFRCRISDRAQRGLPEDGPARRSSGAASARVQYQKGLRSKRRLDGRGDPADDGKSWNSTVWFVTADLATMSACDV